jgi:serine/threonine-protein kinase
MIDFRPNAINPRPERTYPPQAGPNSSVIEIDLRGRLFSLKSVASESWKPRRLDWNELLDAAGLKGAALVQTGPRAVPPLSADARAAWTGKHPEDGTPIRVEAAAWRGVPVFFQITAPWDEKDVTAQVPFAGGGFGRFIMFLSFAAIASGLVLAWRNLRLRRGDRQAALRIGAAIFVLDAIALLIMAEHEPVLGHEIDIFVACLAKAGLWAALFALLYIAVEPYVRRRWPDRLISWARLVAGKWRDPMIGRDISIGIAAGLLHATVAAYTEVLGEMVTGNPAEPSGRSLYLLDTPTAALSHFLDGISSGIITALVLMTVLMLLSIVLRRRWLAIVGFYAIAFTGYTFASTEPWAMVSFALISGLFTLVVARFGMLAIAAMQIAFAVIFSTPLPDAFAWYTARGLTTMVLLFALAVWAFHTSLGGQRAFAANVLDD